MMRKREFYLLDAKLCLYEFVSRKYRFQPFIVVSFESSTLAWIGLTLRYPQGIKTSLFRKF